MLRSLLIANRGEIACRIIRTARKMGIRTVAVYSDADADALHVRDADEAVHIGPSPARESYLVGERIIAAAKATGAQAIHPGYGFLSENAEFAQAVIDSGLVWVGPNPSSITAMGLKDAAKALMQAAGVPTTPGYLGENQEPASLARESAKIGYPVLIKAVAGGGGKGMRLVEKAEDFADALASCQREAAASFGNAHVLIEKYILSPRHIEVQIFGDSHGQVVHLFERDCSLQRRHQKVIEEAPAPGMDAATRAAVCQAAVNAARAVDYVGAGTIEFIADGSEGLRADRIWFMEMNTRLQVEHPVTEEITGQDLVEWQLRVASGEPLPMAQEDLSINGWAMEARLYAEDPAKGFLPSIGRLDILNFPDEDQVRIDTGVTQGSEVSPFYDPMIAKLIVSAPSREQAAMTLKHGVDCIRCWPVKTNSGFLYRLLDQPDFVAGNVTTDLIARHADALCAPAEPSDELWTEAAIRLVDYGEGTDLYSHHSPWKGRNPFRLNGPAREAITIQTGAITRTVDLIGTNEWNELDFTLYNGVVVFADQGQSVGFSVARTKASATGAASDGAILSPMPGRIIAVEVAEGDAVTKGQKLLTLEAMKMEHGLTAPFDGIVVALHAAAGAQVQVDALLARIEAKQD